jgi:hypothetical protein
MLSLGVRDANLANVAVRSACATARNDTVGEAPAGPVTWGRMQGNPAQVCLLSRAMPLTWIKYASEFIGYGAICWNDVQSSGIFMSGA